VTRSGVEGILLTWRDCIAFFSAYARKAEGTLIENSTKF